MSLAHERILRQARAGARVVDALNGSGDDVRALAELIAREFIVGVPGATPDDDTLALTPAGSIYLDSLTGGSNGSS